MDRLLPASSLLLVVDIQERLVSALSEEARTRVIAQAGRLLDGARAIGVRALVTEQYPKGLGPTVAALLDRATALRASPMAKVSFDACADAAISNAIGQSGARSVVLCGVEAHICVMQTARELVRRGYDVHVVADAVASRAEENRAIGLGLAARAGAAITSVETVLFDWVGQAGSDVFKEISKLVR